MSAGSEGRPGGAPPASADDAGEGGLLARWSARKRGAGAVPGGRSSERIGTDAAPSDALPAAAGGTLPAATDAGAFASAAASPAPVADAAGGDAQEPLLGDADMPPIETLDASSDLAPFFNRGVSAALRRAALRQVFANPVYNVRDGLNDYDGDYTVFEPLGGTVTADMRFHAARRERLARERAAEEDAPAREETRVASAADGDAADAPPGEEGEAEARAAPEGAVAGRPDAANGTPPKDETPPAAEVDAAAAGDRPTAAGAGTDGIERAGVGGATSGTVTEPPRAPPVAAGAGDATGGDPERG